MIPAGRGRSAAAVRNGVMPASFTNAMRSRFSMSATGPDTVRVSGVDLVQGIPSSVISTDGNLQLFTVIPANPAYWGGTRIA